MIIGKVLGIDPDQKFIKEGRVETHKMPLLSRLGFNQYSVLKNHITIDRMQD